MKAYRVTTDEPQGICIGFKPGLTECDEFELVEYDYPAETELYVFISLDGKRLALTVDDNYGHRKENHPDWPEHSEPDLMVWHTPDEFDAWAEEVGF